MPVEIATAYITLIPSARGVTAGIEKEMGAPLAAAGRTSGAKSSAAFGSAFKSGIKTAAIGAGVVAGFAAIGASFDKAFDTIALGTGATGKTLQGLDESFKNVLKSGSNSMESVSAAVTTLATRTGLTGKALEDFADKEATLARITGTDINANLQSTTSLFKLFGVAAVNQSDKLDVLFQASQVAGVSITQLTSDMQSAAPTAKILGLNIDQAAGFVANLDKAGLPAGKVMAGLAGAFSKAAKAGKEPLDVIHGLTKEIKAAPSATAAATIAIQKYGIGARQASTLVAALRSGAVDLNKALDSQDAIKKAAAATDDFGEKFAHLKNVALVGLEPLAAQAFGAITKAVELATPAVGFLTDHMEILGPALLAAGAGFAAFKIAVGIQKLVEGAALSFTALKVAVLGTADAEVAATVASKGLLASIGPIGFIAAAIGATLAVIAIKTHLFGKEQQDAGKATNDFIASLLDEGKALKDVAGQVLVKAIRDNKQLGETFKSIHVPLTTVNKALLGNKDAINAVSKAGVIGVRTGKISIDQYAQLTGFVSKNARSLNEQSDAKHRAAAASKDLAGAESGTAGAAKTAALAQDQLRIAATNLTTAIINNADRLRGLQEGLVGVLQSAINLKQGLTDIAEKQAAYNVFLKAGTQNTKEGVKAEQDLELARLGLIGDTDRAIDGAIKQADAQSHLTDHLKSQGAAQDALTKAQQKGDPTKITAAQDDLDRATKSVANSQTIQTEALQRLADRVKGPLHEALVQYLHDTQAPKPIVTRVTTPGLTAASKGLKSYKDGLDKIPLRKPTKIDLDATAALSTLGQLKAAVAAINPNVSLVAVTRADAGGRASGGPVAAGRSYIVGEKGVELLTLNAGGGGFVTSHDQLQHPAFEVDHRSNRAAVNIGAVYTRDERELMNELDKRQRRAEILAGV